jgi:spore coat protein CotF
MGEDDHNLGKKQRKLGYSNAMLEMNDPCIRQQLKSVLDQQVIERKLIRLKANLEETNKLP